MPSWTLRSVADRRYAIEAVTKAKDGLEVTIAKPKRTVEQNRLLHGALKDIKDQLGWPKDTGELHDMDWWKRRLCLAWLIETRQEREIITDDLLGTGEFVALLPHTSDLNVEQLSALCEYIFAFGAQNGVVFKVPAQQDAPADV